MKETLTDDVIRKAIDELKAEGARVIVASSAFASMTTRPRRLVRRLVVEVGLPRPAATRSPSCMA